MKNIFENVVLRIPYLKSFKEFRELNFNDENIAIILQDMIKDMRKTIDDKMKARNKLVEKWRKINQEKEKTCPT